MSMPVTGINDPFRIQNIGRDDLYIEAFIPSDEGYQRVQIDLGRIAYRKEISAKISALILADGKEVPIALPLNELRQKINDHSFKDGEMIDLKPFTGEAANISPDGSLKIKLYVHFKDAAEKEFALATIDLDHVEKLDPRGYIHLKEGFRNKAMIQPCTEGVFMKLPIDYLKEVIKDAQTRRQAVVDLTEKTKPQAPDKIRAPITL